MGDFNANQIWDKKFFLFTNLNTANTISLMDFHNISTPTWTGPTTNSRLMISGVLQTFSWTLTP